jgi:hypothetical protein
MMGFFRLTKGGQASTDSDRIFAELAHERFCRPYPTAVSASLEALRQGLADRTLEVILHTAIKDGDLETFTIITPDRPPCPDAKAKEAVTDNRNAAATSVATTAQTNPGTKAMKSPKPPPKT